MCRLNRRRSGLVGVVSARLPDGGAWVALAMAVMGISPVMGQTLHFNPGLVGPTNWAAGTNFSTSPTGPFTSGWVSGRDVVFGGGLGTGTTLATQTVLVGTAAVPTVTAGTIRIAQGTVTPAFLSPTVVFTNYSTGSPSGVLGFSSITFDQTGVTSPRAAQVIFDGLPISGNTLTKTGIGNVTLRGAPSAALTQINFAGPGTPTGTGASAVASSLSINRVGYTTSSTAVNFDLTGASDQRVRMLVGSGGAMGSTTIGVGNLSATGTPALGSRAPLQIGPNTTASLVTLNVNQTANGTLPAILNGFTSNLTFNKQGAGTLTLTSPEALSPAGLTVNVQAGRINLAATSSRDDTQNTGSSTVMLMSVSNNAALGAVRDGIGLLRDYDEIPAEFDEEGNEISPAIPLTPAYSPVTGRFGTTASALTGGFTLTTSGTNALIDPAGTFGVTRLTSTSGVRVRMDSARDHVGTYEFRRPTANGGLVLDLSGFTNAESGVVYTPLSWQLTPAGALTTANVAVTLPPLAALDTTYGVGGILISATDVSVRLVPGAGAYVPRELTWTGAASGTWDTAAANFSGGATIYAQGNGIGNLTRGDRVTFTDAGAGTVTVRPAGVAPSSVTFDAASDYTLAGGPVSGPGSVTKLGAGTLTLSASNTHTGGTRLVEGTINANTAGALGSGPLSLGSFTTLEVNANQSVSGGDFGTLSQVNVNGAASTLTWSGSVFSSEPNALLVKEGTGTLRLDGQVFLDGQVRVDGGTLAMGPGATFNNFTGNGDLTVVRLGTGGHIDASANNNRLIVNDNCQLSFEGGTYTGHIENYSSLVFADPSVQTFSGDIAGQGTITVDNGAVVTLTGTLTNQALDVADGRLTLTKPFRSESIMSFGMFGSGIVLDVPGSASVNTVVADVASVLAVRFNDVRVAPIDRTTLKSTVLISDFLNASGFVDLGTGDAILRFDDLAAVRGLVSRWYNGGAPVESGLGASGASTTPFTTLAVFGNGDGWLSSEEQNYPEYTTFAGQPVGLGDILVKYTWMGDTDLNGVLDGRDFNRILSSINNDVPGLWQYGDVNYDGVVDLADFELFMQAYAYFQASGFPLDGSPAGGGAPIPEPAAIAFASLPLPLLARRRRHARR